jgi:hypothetical protein
VFKAKHEDQTCAHISLNLKPNTWRHEAEQNIECCLANETFRHKIQRNKTATEPNYDMVRARFMNTGTRLNIKASYLRDKKEPTLFSIPPRKAKP